ncbi:MAG: serine/threonine protein kinase, partial [Myxococcales bacterium]|nr:serine/threonine protein kinase [Myxococcales bacterium]
GMGEVYDATRVSTGEPAAVKLLHSVALQDREALERFAREVRVAASLKAKNVVEVLGFSTDEGAIPYLAMERLRGKDLAAILRKTGAMDLPWAITLVRQVGEGLSAAAKVGIVHRDIKPQNLFLARTGDGGATWKILDFGVSKLAQSEGTLTRGRLIGTPAYMAPEQAKGDDVDHRADIYSLAAIVYRTLTGYRPFRGHDLAAIIHAVVNKMPIRPSQILDLPEEIDLVLAVGLAKLPEERFQTCDDLLSALEEARSGRLSPELARRADLILQRNPWRDAPGSAPHPVVG